MYRQEQLHLRSHGKLRSHSRVIGRRARRHVAPGIPDGPKSMVRDVFRRPRPRQNLPDWQTLARKH